MEVLKVDKKENIKADFQNRIHWYPGHIAKAERELKAKISLVDVVIEVLDARIPFSSSYGDTKKLLGDKPRLILLNKSDLVEDRELKLWIKHVEERFGCPVFITEKKSAKDFNKIISKVIELSEPKIQGLMKKGLLRRPARVMVIGMPNVGKSSIINKLTKTSKTKVGAKAGVTRQQQWVKVNPKLDLLDTPGIIPTTQDDQNKAYKLAFVNSVSENAYDFESAATELLKILGKKYNEQVKAYYKMDIDEELSLESIAGKRNWIKKGSIPDTERTAIYFLTDFRDGKIGKFILDDIE